jgi:hypothetical protein
MQPMLQLEHILYSWPHMQGGSAPNYVLINPGLTRCSTPKVQQATPLLHPTSLAGEEIHPRRYEGHLPNLVNVHFHCCCNAYIQSSYTATR